MVEKYLGKEQADSIYMSAMITGLMTEKQAGDLCDKLEKRSSVPEMLKDIFSNAYKGIVTPVKDLYATGFAGLKGLGLLATLGAGAGVLGSSAYDVIKERISEEDPETKFNNEVEAVYNNRKRELEDQKWMSKVRSMRDELRRGYKKMSTEEYAAKYQKLQDALDERMT